MIEYDPKDIGKKVKEIHPNLQGILSLLTIPEHKQCCIGYIQGKILECMVSKDIITAVAITNCAIGITGITPQEFNLKFIEQVAEENNYGDFAIGFIGVCSALNYIDETN